MTRVARAGRITFAALAVPNYRRYYIGQAVSLTGTWMQMTAQAWLVLTLTHSSTALGLIVALQTLPVLLLTPYGGVVADRSDKRRIMIALQSAMAIQALVLGVLTVTGSVRVWEIGLLAAALGVSNAFENPSRQSFMLELVGHQHLRNAVTLNSVLVNVARTLGPAVAGILIATVGDGVCFLINAASFVAVIASLVTLDLLRIERSKPTPRAPGQLREGLRYVRSTPGLAVPLLMMAAVGCLTYEFQVSLPVMASRGLRVGASGFGFMTAAMGIGAVCGGLLVAARGKTGLRPLILAAWLFGAMVAGAALARSLPLELVALALTGGASIAFMSTGNSTLQLNAAPSMRGRVMALWFVAFQGSTPIGGPVIGWIMAVAGARAGLGVGALTCLLVAAAGAIALRRSASPAPAAAPAPSPRRLSQDTRHGRASQVLDRVDLRGRRRLRLERSDGGHHRAHQPHHDARGDSADGSMDHLPTRRRS
jgi:MFS family permease